MSEIKDYYCAVNHKKISYYDWGRCTKCIYVVPGEKKECKTNLILMKMTDKETWSSINAGNVELHRKLMNAFIVNYNRERKLKKILK